MAKNQSSGDSWAEIKAQLDWPKVYMGLGGLALVSLIVLKILFGGGGDKLAECRANLDAIAAAAKNYKIKNARYPASLSAIEGKELKALPFCPVARQMTYTDYAVAYSPHRMTVSCCGGHHAKQASQGSDPNKYPQVSEPRP